MKEHVHTLRRSEAAGTRLRIKLKKPNKPRSVVGNTLAYLVLLTVGVFTALPIIYSIICSFKPLSELFIYPPEFFIRRPSLDNFKLLFELQQNMLVPVERYLFNSVFVSAVTTFLYILVASLAAFPLAKKDFPGKKIVLQVLIFAILFRPEVLQVPQYLIIAKLKMVDTYFAIIVPMLIGSFGVFLMRQFMVGVPDSVIESAKIDGAGQFRIFFNIIMPLVKTAWLTLVIFTFKDVWASTGTAFIYKENMKLLPTALSQMASAGMSMAGVLSAAGVIMMVPPILIFIFTQKNVIETMAYSGIKT